MKTKTSILARILPTSLLFFGFLFAASLHGAPEIEVTDKGEILVDHIKLRAVVIDGAAKYQFLNVGNFKQLDFKRKAETTEMRAEVKLPNKRKGVLTQNTRKNSDGELDYKASFKFDPSATIKNLMLVPMTFSVARFAGQTLEIDGKPLVLPEQAPKRGGGEAELFNKKIKSLEIPLHSGTLIIRGDFNLRLLDLRASGSPHYSVRIGFTPQAGQLSEAKLNLTFATRD